jgi:hypothetical protein
MSSSKREYCLSVLLFPKETTGNLLSFLLCLQVYIIKLTHVPICTPLEIYSLSPHSAPSLSMFEAHVGTVIDSEQPNLSNRHPCVYTTPTHPYIYFPVSLSLCFSFRKQSYTYYNTTTIAKITWILQLQTQIQP